MERVGDHMLLVHFESDVLFSVNSALVNEYSREALDEAADVLMEFRKTAVIAQGHTDASGSEEHNQRLSERRAEAVIDYLVGRGVDGSRMTAVGYGEGHPVAENGSDYGRRQNRRVDLLLKAKAR